MDSKYFYEPLTEEEKVFAGDIVNFNKFEEYLKSHKLDFSEWYDILVLSYIKAVKKYLTIPRLRKFSFGQILFRTLDNGRSNYFKAQCAQKRYPLGGFIHLDAEIEHNNGKLIVSEIIENTKPLAEESIIDSERVQDMLNVLDDEQINIVKLLFQGYSQTEIAKSFNINISVIHSKIQKIRNIVSNYIERGNTERI